MAPPLRLFDGLGWPDLPRLASGSTDQPMWRKLIARYLLLARAILPLLRHTRGAARGRRKPPRRLPGLGSAAFSPFYCDKNPDGERPAFWKTGLLFPFPACWGCRIVHRSLAISMALAAVPGACDGLFSAISVRNTASLSEVIQPAADPLTPSAQLVALPTATTAAVVRLWPGENIETNSLGSVAMSLERCRSLCLLAASTASRHQPTTQVP